MDQRPGISDQQLLWMHSEASKISADRSGGIILDEMSVQQEVSLKHNSKNIELCGMVDMGQTANAMHRLQHHRGVHVATHVLQFIFLSFDGFRFPFCWYPTSTINGPELNVCFWEIMDKLTQWEFDVRYVCMDGSSGNRVFLNMNVTKDDKEKDFSCPNIFRPSKRIVFLMDYGHVIKRIRNNIYSSGGAEHCTRLLQIDSEFIVWDHFIQAYKWDKSTNPIRVHQHLTDEYIFLTKQSKMRNRLAELVLNSDMLHLMELYSETLVKKDSLKATLELLKHTSVLVQNFRDPRPIISSLDERLQKNYEALVFLKKWEENTSKQDMLMSRETREDIESLITGFHSICVTRFEKGMSVTAAGVNSDVVENNFCQQRALLHGANTNPTVLQYGYRVNSTILGQQILSKKSNAAAVKRVAEPHYYNSSAPLGKRKPFKELQNNF